MRRRRVRRSQSRSELSAGRTKRRRKVKVRRCRPRSPRGPRRVRRGDEKDAASRSRSRSRSSNSHRSVDANPGDKGDDCSEGTLDGKQNKADEASEDDASMRIWVASNDCARIIGKGGRTMRDAEARSHAKLKVQKEDSGRKEERYIDIIGTKKEQSAALEILLELASFCRDDDGKVLKERGQNDDADGDNGEKNTALVLEVLPDEAGKILGRKGETVNSIEQESGARIELDKGSGRLTVHGSKDAQDKARELLLAEVSFAKEAGEGGAVLKGEAARPDATDGDSEKEVEKTAAEKVMRIWVKDAQAGRVIGHGGENVRKVMETTGAEVKVQKSGNVKRGCQEREIVISGQKEQQEQAVELILAEVTWARNEDGILKTPPEEADESKKPEKRVRRSRKGSRRRRRGDGRASRSEDKSVNNGGAEAVGEGDAPSKKTGKAGLWVCATCGGDHRTKECPQSTGMQVGMKIGMQMATGMPMGIPPMPMPMGMPMGMPPPMLGMPMMGLPGLPMGLLPPLHPGLGGLVGGSRRRRRSVSGSSSCCSSSESAAARSCSASGNAEESAKNQPADQDGSDAEEPDPDDGSENVRSGSRSRKDRNNRGASHRKRHRSKSRKTRKKSAKDGLKASALPSESNAPAAKAAKIDFSDL